MKELGMSCKADEVMLEALLGQSVRWGKFPPAGGDCPQKILKSWCFLLHSRYSSALFQGQNFSPDLKTNLNFTN